MITTNTVELLTGPAQNVSLVEQAFMWAGTILVGSMALLVSIVAIGVIYAIVKENFFSE